MGPLEQQPEMTVAEHERGWALKDPDSPYGELRTVRELTRQHIAAARMRIDRSRRPGAADTIGREPEHLPTPAPDDRANVPREREQTVVCDVQCLSCTRYNPRVARFCMQCGAPMVRVSEVTAALVRNSQRIFVEAALAFAHFLGAEGVEVSTFWEECRQNLANPALVKHDREVIAKWNAALGLNYEAELSSVRRAVGARVAEWLRTRRQSPP